MKNLLLLLAITLSTLTYGQDTYWDEASKEKIEKMEGDIWRVYGSRIDVGYESIAQLVTTYSNPMYSGYVIIKDGLVYKCSRKGNIKGLFMNKGIYVSGSSSNPFGVSTRVMTMPSIGKFKSYHYTTTKKKN
tara:strand:- start:108 stop:503 length:396 start_codon:yes stop_codon:yes gene_type:complete